MTSSAIPQRLGLVLQLAAITGAEPETSFLELRWRQQVGMGQAFYPCREAEPILDVIEKLARKTDVYIGAAPRVRRSGTADAVERTWCLRADCDTVEAVERLRDFRPEPGIIVRSGTGANVHAWWPLRRPLASPHAVRANRRLALALGADRAVADAARVMRPVGGLNHKHPSPTAVECVRLELDAFDAAEVAGRLPDDPAYTPATATARISRETGPGALGGLVRVVREASVGERNARLNWAAYRAGEHVAARTIDPSEAEAQLVAAALDVGLDDQEARRTVASGLGAAGGRS